MKYLFLILAMLCMAHTNCQVDDIMLRGADSTRVPSTPLIIDAEAEGDTYVVKGTRLVKVEDAPTVKVDPDNAAFLLGYVGGSAAIVDGGNRNGLNYGLEAHVILKQDVRFGVDFGGGIGYSSLSLPGGKAADIALHASVGFTDNRFVSGGIRMSYTATDGHIAPSGYLALSYSISDRLSAFGRGTFGITAVPADLSYTTGRAQIGVAYHLLK